MIRMVRGNFQTCDWDFHMILTLLFFTGHRASWFTQLDHN